MAPRSPHLHHALRSFTLGAFGYLLRELDAEGGQLPFAFEEHARRRGPALYEYRPLVRGFIEDRADRLRVREDAVIALEELRREPAAAIYARAHAGRQLGEDDALFRTVLVDLLVRTGEACGGFDWDDDAFDHAYHEFERSLFGERRTYAAVAPLVGLSVGVAIDLGPLVCACAPLPTASWRGTGPRQGACFPKASAVSPTGTASLELRPALGAGEDVPDAPAEIADAVSAAAARDRSSAGCGPGAVRDARRRPYGIRPVLPIAATQPPGEPSRLDSFRGALAGELLTRLGIADTDTPLAEALDRWELSLFQNEPFRSEQLRAVARHAARLHLGAPHRPFCSRRSRWRAPRSTRPSSHSTEARRPRRTVTDAVRRALVETLRHGIARRADARARRGPARRTLRAARVGRRGRRRAYVRQVPPFGRLRLVIVSAYGGRAP